MIQVKKGNAPEIFAEKGYKNKIADVCSNPSKHKCSDYFYSKKPKEYLRKMYGNKCAYCESTLEVTSSVEVDHFRPKNKIDECKDHPGYYWLTYEWSNLVPSCQKCNRHKSNKFPLADENSRVHPPPQLDQKGIPLSNWTNPDQFPLDDERRLLLNPEWDEVEKHLYFTPDGKIHSDTAEGKASIEAYDLDRDGLVSERRKKSEKHLNFINSYLDKLKHGEIHEETLYTVIEELLLLIVFTETNLRNNGIEFKYSAYGSFMISNFKEFYIDRCGDPESLKKVYQKIQIEYPFLHNHT